MAALKLNLDTLDGIEEALKPLYVEKDGKFFLSVEGTEDTSGLKTALQKERRDRAELEKKVKRWEGLGKSDEEIAKLLKDTEDAERKKAEADGDHAKILKQHQDKWAKTEADLKSELDVARASERNAIVGERIMGALGKDGATEEGLDLIPDRLASRIHFDTKDGKRVLKIMQADGETPMAGTGPEGVATIDDLVKEAKQKWPSLFKGTGATGSGTQPSTGGGATTPAGIPKSWADAKTMDEKAAFIKHQRTLGAKTAA
jgi:hypothetical protein